MQLRLHPVDGTRPLEGEDYSLQTAFVGSGGCMFATRTQLSLPGGRHGIAPRDPGLKLSTSSPPWEPGAILLTISLFSTEFFPSPQPLTAPNFRLQPPRLLSLVDEYPKRGQPPQRSKILRPPLRRRQGRLQCQLPQNRPLCPLPGHRRRRPRRTPRPRRPILPPLATRHP